MEKAQNQFHSKLVHSLMLLLASAIWGMAFPMQSIGADYLPGWTYLASRSWIAVAVMAPLLPGAGKKAGQRDLWPLKKALPAGILCGIFLCLGSGLQQLGIAYTTSAKAGFISAMYVVLVPLFGRIFGRKIPAKIWLCLALCVLGLSLLCLQPGSFGIGKGDILILLCAVSFSFQIMTVDRYVDRIGAFRLSYIQFVTQAVLSTVLALLSESPDPAGFMPALPSILYAGIFSSAGGYTLQAYGQQGTNPAVASLIMCMESVFSAIGGFLILHERLTARELAGCVLMLLAIVLAELPERKQLRKM